MNIAIILTLFSILEQVYPKIKELYTSLETAIDESIDDEDIKLKSLAEKVAYLKATGEVPTSYVLP